MGLGKLNIGGELFEFGVVVDGDVDRNMVLGKRQVVFSKCEYLFCLEYLCLIFIFVRFFVILLDFVVIIVVNVVGVILYFFGGLRGVVRYDVDILVLFCCIYKFVFVLIFFVLLSLSLQFLFFWYLYSVSLVSKFNFVIMFFIFLFGNELFFFCFYILLYV